MFANKAMKRGEKGKKAGLSYRNQKISILKYTKKSTTKILENRLYCKPFVCLLRANAQKCLDPFSNEFDLFAICKRVKQIVFRCHSTNKNVAVTLQKN